MSEEEVKSTLEAVASTGKFWQEWEKLKGTLSCWLKKVLSEYPEAKMTAEQQKEALGETYSELPFFVSMKALHLQCRDSVRSFWVLAATSIYPKLSKLALALEKNLLVTSMLAISTGANRAPNGIEAMGGDLDEILTEVDEAMTIDMETLDGPSATMTTSSESETSSETTSAKPSSDSMAVEEGDSEVALNRVPPASDRAFLGVFLKY